MQKLKWGEYLPTTNTFILLGAPASARLTRPVRTAARSVCGWRTVFHACKRWLFASRLNVFSKGKSDAASTGQFFLADIGDHGVPPVVACVRSENSGDFVGGDFKELCAERGIRHEFTTPDTLKLVGVVCGGARIRSSLERWARFLS